MHLYFNKIVLKSFDKMDSMVFKNVLNEIDNFDYISGIINYDLNKDIITFIFNCSEYSSLNGYFNVPILEDLRHPIYVLFEQYPELYDYVDSIYFHNSNDYDKYLLNEFIQKFKSKNNKLIKFD